MLYDMDALTFSDFESDPNEKRFVTLGMSSIGRVLVSVYTIRNEEIRMVSARKATPHEREEYSEQ